MKKLLYTQRIDIVSDYNERRDCADQNIARFVRACGYIPLPIPNIPELAEEFINSVSHDGIILTGGNDLSSYGGDAPERDAVENFLIKNSLDSNTPLLGFCRGMQMIADYIGAKLEKISGHAGIRHSICGEINCAVNSYHNFGILSLPDLAEVLAQSEDGVIEALRYKNLLGIMWHPEREKPFNQIDMELFIQHFGV